MHLSLRFAGPCTLVAFLISPAAHGQPALPSAPGSGQKEAANNAGEAFTDKARELYEQGRKDLDSGRWAQACAALSASWALKKHWQIAANLGQCEDELGQHAKAAEHYAYYVREASPERKEKAKALFEKVRAKVGEVKVQVDRAGADVLVDGALAGRSPLNEPVFVMPGKHTLQMRVANEVLAEQSIDAAAGGSYEVTLAAKAERAMPSQTAEPQAEQPRAEQLSATQPELPSKDSKLPVRKIVIGAGIGTTAVLIGTGVAFAIVSSMEGTEADKLAEPLAKDACRVPGQNAAVCGQIDEHLRKQTTLGNAALWTFIAGGVVGGGTLVYALVAPRQSRKTAVRILPVAGTDGGGVLVHGQW